MSRAGWILLLLAVAIPLASAPSAGATGYDLTAPGSLDTPERTVELGGNQYTVSAVARTAPGESLTVEAEIPGTDAYRVLIHNADQQVVERSDRATEDAAFQFDVVDPPYDPGSYAITLFADGVHQELLPLVVSGFRVELDAPTSGVAGESVEASVEVTRTHGSKPIDAVEVALVNDEVSKRFEAVQSDAGEYAATVSLDGIEPGEYRLYAAVRGEHTAFGRHERLGLSDEHGLAVTEETSSGGSGAGGGGGGGLPPSSPAPTGTTSTTTSATPAQSTPVDGSTPQLDPTETPGDGEQTDGRPAAQSGSSPTDAATPTPDRVITPAPTPGADTEPTTTAQPGFGVLAGLLALVGATGLAALRARHRRR